MCQRLIISSEVDATGNPLPLYREKVKVQLILLHHELNSRRICSWCWVLRSKLYYA